MFALPLVSALLLPPVAPAEFVSKPDVLYAEVDGVKLKLDLFLPKGKGPHPVVLCFHGGAWVAGDRKDLTKPALFNPGGSDGTHDYGVLENLAKNGFAAASVSYRLAPKHKFPAQIEDAKTAVRFVRKNAAAYDLDPDRIAAMGFSAGGHLAALLGTTGKADGLDGPLLPGVSSEAACVVDYFGPTDLTLYGESPDVVASFLAPVFGKAAATDPSVLKRASPLAYAGKGSKPFLIVHGTLDFVVPYVHSELLHKKLTDAGVPSELVPIRWKGHGWQDPAAVDAAAKATLKFLAAQLKPEGAKK